MSFDEKMFLISAMGTVYCVFGEATGLAIFGLVLTLGYRWLLSK